MMKTLVARVTPLTAGGYVNVADRGGSTTVKWRSVTNAVDYTLKDNVSMRHRTIVFRAVAVPTTLSHTIARVPGSSTEFLRMGFKPASELTSWIGMMFDGVTGTAVMTAKAQGPGVSVLSDKMKVINGSGDAGKFLSEKHATQLGVSLKYEHNGPGEFMEIGTGGVGPAYMLELVQVGHPEDEDIGTFVMNASVKVKPENMQTDRPLFKIPTAPPESGAEIAEMSCTLKIYHY